MIPEKIIKQIGVLQGSYNRGLINTIELQNLFKMVEQETSALPSKKGKQDARFIQQMENLDRGRAKKPIV